MRDTFVFILTGDTGSGKSVTALSYLPKGQATASRMVVDKEYRASHYQNLTQADDPSKLLFNFDLLLTDGQDMTLEKWGTLVTKVKAKTFDVLIFDNMAMLQDDIEGWCQDAVGTRKFLASVGDDKKHEMFLKFRFSNDQYWRKALQGAMRSFLLLCKQNEIDVVITTELQNKWQNYGVRGNDADGKPMARIIGKQSKIWERTLQMADVNWFLKRTVAGKIQGAPMVGIDPLRPKMSIVGIPPEFQFKSWEDVWAYSVKRDVPTDEALAKVAMPGIEYSEGAEPEVDPVKQKEEKREDLLKEAAKLGFTDMKEMEKILKPKKLWPFDQSRYDETLAALKEAKQK